MILLFGGTTEGRNAVEVLEEAGSPYYYSTKTGEQKVALHHGVRMDGALDEKAMRSFSLQHDIRLMVDAAHPFAILLHRTIASVAQSLGIPVVRYERIYPPRAADIIWIDDYEQVPRDIRTLLATTGVQSIARLKPLEQEGMKICYRILPRESSKRLAYAQGAADAQLCYYADGMDLGEVDAEAILLKESGLTGGFLEKVEAARKKGMRIVALKRPVLPEGFVTVDGPHGLRRTVEHLLPEFFPLHSGLTTGTCATAAAVAGATWLLKNEKPGEVPVVLPNGETISVAVGYGNGDTYCVKEAGDDPDVTNGLEVHAAISMRSMFLKETVGKEPVEQSGVLQIEGGEGVGHFTLPGFDYPPGEAAINRGPREMIARNLKAMVSPQGIPLSALRVVISVPGGEEVAKRTFNPRLGIEGGISIIGVSGIVKPFSEEAFVDSIRKCMQVAKASATDCVVINSGAKSERFIRSRYPHLPRQAFVEYGNYIGETLRMADELQFNEVVLGVMLGKAVKLAAGHLDTHSRKTVMDKAFVAQMLEQADVRLDMDAIALARELWKQIPEEKTDAFCRVVIGRCMDCCKPLLKHARLTLLLIADDGTIHSL